MSAGERLALRQRIEAAIRRRAAVAKKRQAVDSVTRQGAKSGRERKAGDSDPQWMPVAAYEVSSDGEIRALTSPSAEAQWKPPAPPFPRRAGKSDPTWWGE